MEMEITIPLWEITKGKDSNSLYYHDDFKYLCQTEVLFHRYISY